MNPSEALEIDEENRSRSAIPFALEIDVENRSRSAILLALEIDEKNRSRSAILLAQIALFTATIFVRNTRLYAEHDRTGFKTALSYQIIVTLVSNSRRLSDLPCLEFIHKKCVWMVNAILNTFCLILAIVFEEIYEEIFEKSLSSLGFVLSITVLLLILLVIIRPSTDLGFFGFLIGVIGLVTHNLFRLKFQTWIVVASCSLLIVFRFWLETKWMESQPQPPAKRCREGGYYYISWIIEVLTVAGFHLFWVYNLFSTNCQALEGQPKSLSCTSSSAMGTACVLIFNLYLGLLIRLVPPKHKRDPKDGKDTHKRHSSNLFRIPSELAWDRIQDIQGTNNIGNIQGTNNIGNIQGSKNIGNIQGSYNRNIQGSNNRNIQGTNNSEIMMHIIQGTNNSDNIQGTNNSEIRRRGRGDGKPLSTSSAQEAIAPKKED